MLAAAADEPHGLSQQVEALLTALKAVLPGCQASSSLLRQILQSTTSTESQAIPAQQLQEACQTCSKMFAFVENAGHKTDSETSYDSLDTNAAILQPYIIHAAAAFLDFAKVTLLSKEWLQMAGSELFATVATATRTAIKDSIIPLLCSLVAKGTFATGMAVLEPYERLVTIGSSSADIIAGRLQVSQAKELRSFAVLNLAWSSIIRLLLVLANLPEQPRIAQSFQVAHLLQLLIGYVGHDFDILMEQQDLNQLKVVRFWAQHLTRLATAFTAVSQTGWSPVAAMTAHMHNHMPLIRDADGEAMQNTCQEVQQHVLSKLGNLAAVCLPDCGPGRGMPPWIHALCCQATTPASEGSPASQSLEAIPMAGKLVTALGILQHGACKHLYVRALTCAPLRAAIAQAVMVFMAACCRNRETGGAWQQCELFLFRQAMMPTPLRLHLLAEVWCAVVRQSSPGLAESHVQALHKLVMSVAHCCDAYQPTGDAKLEPADQHMASHALQQLTQLTAHLLQAMPLHPRQHLAQTLLWAAQGSCGVTAGTAAAVAATLRVLQLTSSASQPALPAEASRQVLQDTNRAVDQSDKGASGVLLTCMAEAVGLQQIIAEQADCTETRQSFQMTIELIGKHDSKAAPYVAALAASYAEAQSPPVQLFHIILEERHWALQHEAMESLLLYVRSPKSGDFKQVLPKSLYNPETAGGGASPFIAMLKEYMQRSPAAATAVSALDYSQMEARSHAAFERLPCLVAQQQACDKPAHAHGIRRDLSSSIAQAVQALEHIHCSATAQLPMHDDAQRAVMQEQLTLLAEIAQGVMLVSGESLQSSRCTCCGGNRQNPQQGALLFRRPWHLPRSASQRDSHFGKRSASTLARSKKDDGPTDRQSDSNKTSSGADSHDDLAPLRKMMAVKAKAENAPKPKFSLQNAVARQWNAFTSLAPGSIGLPGTAAILAGYYLHLDPYGHLHWSSPDALVGLAAAVPIALGDATLMIPDFSAKSTKKYIKLNPSLLQAEAAQQSAMAGTPFEVAVTQREQQNIVQETLEMWQRKAVLENPGLDFTPPVEGLIILLNHLANEMLVRAIILKGLSGWVTDRLYEAGAEDTLSLAGDASMSIPETGKWTALAVLLGVQFGAAAWGLLSPPRITIQGIDNLSDKASSKVSPDNKKQKVMGMLTKMTQKMSKQRKAAIVVQTARDSLSAAALGGSFILTDNLLTPFVAGVSCDLLFSVYQRAKFNSLQSRTQQHMMSMLEDFQEVKKASQRLKESVSAPGHDKDKTEH
ncbi:hypothetical protein WJX79_004303 [Trebouxia sp. C0005]